MVNGTDGVQKIYPDAITHAKYFCFPTGHWEGEDTNDEGDGWYSFSSSGQIRFTCIPNGSTGCSDGISDHAKALSQGFMCSADDWRNFEGTWYIKHESGSDQYTIYGRGGTHSDSCACCGFAYKLRLFTDGGMDVAIETWHVHYQFFGKKSVTSDLDGRIVGLKFICYDTPSNPQTVTCEGWLDNNNNNSWSKVFSWVDDGKSDDGGHCGTADDQVGLWGGPELTFRTDGLSYTFTKLSAREINPSGNFTDDGSGGSTGGGTGGGTPPPPPPTEPQGAGSGETPWLDGYTIVNVVASTGSGGTGGGGGPPPPPPTPTPPPPPPTAPLTDRTDLSFTSAGYTSSYHLYAAGLNWSKSVGLLIYTDGSGEYGLKHVSDSYLMAGTNGMIAVAKRNNMILLTPLSPNKACADGDGSCWYMGDSEGYAEWAEDLVTQVETDYAINKNRVAVGGYSSGAQFTMEWWIPSGAAQRTMTDGVCVGISYGGSPKMTEVTYDASFKSNVHLNWNVGDEDNAYQNDGSYDVQSGYDHYTADGFQTSLDVIPNQGHDRDGDFGSIMEDQITEHVPPAT